METENLMRKAPRRGFLGSLAAGAAAIGLASLAPFRTEGSQQKAAPPKSPPPAMNSADEWFRKVKGTHRVVFDATRPHEIMPFVWPKVFIMTNGATGSPESDCGVVVVLRHDAIAYAFKDEMWAKYNFAEMFKAGEVGGAFQAADAATATKTRNPFWNTKTGDFAAPGIGPVDIGIKDLQKQGVMFCVCNAAMTVFSAVAAMQMKMTAEEVMKEWKENLIPEIMIVPSGVWALGRAQEHGCRYIFAG